ncbi:unnamed protein product [Polarella glacialis]|uniref:sn-1-specific diacylglycerol lipase n=1 Tax=Polarella glacialis TaxID=89957 RepID=A0A813HZ55_POLGL|nr:unnamed protein product [Polarella glacialis]
MLYLSAEQRKAIRDKPDDDKFLAESRGQPLPPALLKALLGMAMIGTFITYYDNPFEVQRFALQQRWRLVTERLGESWKHRPAWCLFISQDQRTAAVSIRGTDVEQSRGGDIFTDINARPERYATRDGACPLVAHSGMLAAALALEAELRPTLRALVDAGYRLILTGHSLGGAVAALLVWLLRHGTNGEQLPQEAEVLGIGYAMPAVVDRDTAEQMKPFFSSLINSMDAVPRLSLGTLSRLGSEVRACARESGSDLDQDLQHYVDRLSTVWAPRLRDGNPQVAAATTSALQPQDGTASSPARVAGEGDNCSIETPGDAEDADLYVPGNCVWIYRVRGHLEASVVPCDLPPLRRLILDKRMFQDHTATAIHQALLAVRASSSSASGSASAPRWQKFCEASELCPCCGSRYEWMNTARSGKMRCHAMTNCRCCGLVVCVACATSRRALPEQGILEAARVCDRCVWRGSNDAEVLEALSQVYAELGGHSAGQRGANG